MVLAALVAVFSFPASAHMMCGKYDLETAIKRDGAEIVWSGVSSGGNLVRLIEAPGGLWTLFITTPQGEHCLVDFKGRKFEEGKGRGA